MDAAVTYNIVPEFEREMKEARPVVGRGTW